MKRARDFHERDQVALIITRLAAIVGLLVAISLPLFNLFTSFNDVNDALRFKARIKSAALSGLVASSPDVWMYAENRIQGLIAREPVPLVDEQVNVFDTHGTLVMQSGLVPQKPVFSSSFPLYDSARVVGRLEVIGSLRGLLLETAVAALLGLLLGALVFVVMRVLPLRALRRVTDALVEEKERAQTTLNSIGDAVITTDLFGHVQYLNPAAERLTGWPLAQACGQRLPDVFRIINPVTRETVANPVQGAIAQGHEVALSSLTVLQARDGQEYQVADSAAPIHNGAGEIVGAVLVFSDVSEQCRVQEALLESQAILQAAMDQNPAGVAIADAPDGALRYVNDAGLAIRGEDRNTVVYGLGIEHFFSNMQLLDLDGRTLGAEEVPLARAILFGETGTSEFRIRRADASERIVMSRAAPIRNKDGEVIAGISIFIDITERKMAEDEIKRLAFYDQLTGLPNRRFLIDRLGQALAARSRYQREGALLFIDLDNFKTLNDTLGHDLGDLLLRQVSQRLIACIRESDMVARIGGDEFVVMLENLSEDGQEAAKQSEAVGEKILAALNQSYQLASATHRSAASIGIALFGDVRESVEDLLKRADLAMYRAKAAGRNTLCFFNPEMQAVVTARALLEADLHEALRQEQFVVYYQAQLDSLGRTIGAEALLRWHHPGRGLISPVEFIPLCEENGLIVAVGQWVFEMACRQLAAWAKRPELAHLTLAVNVSARQFHHRDFANQVLAALEGNLARADLLTLELTESVLLDDVDDVVAKMAVLKAKGVCFSLDDFGTGYSSLGYLKRLPLDQLKIDQSFVRDVLSDPNHAAIARSIVALGQSLGLAVIAEGVETEAQRDFLASNGCLAFQGYLFSRPLPLDGFEQFAQKTASARQANDPEAQQ
jgi:diguanylate cyclase (GGDEF)-like protein/PAS domain S-box-containing protein